MFDWLLQNGLSALGIGGYVIVGVSAILGFYKKDDGRRKDSDDVADTLINRLQERVKQLEEDSISHAKMRDDQIKTLTSQVDHLSGRNGVLEDLFKGRDPAMQVFLKSAPELIHIAKENNGLARESAQGLQNLEATLAKFVDTLQPILIHLELQKKPRSTV